MQGGHIHAYKDPPYIIQSSFQFNKSSDDRSQNKCSTNHKIAKPVAVDGLHLLVYTIVA